jgi:glycosyltransferase involved in cell wall biosynthesis
MNRNAWVSFCISTYKRPSLLQQQLALLLAQTFTDFHIVVSDNDVEGSAKPVCELFMDERIKYFNNGANLGMMNSFNKSIDRAETEYIVMCTDDDPIETNFLKYFYNIFKQYPEYSSYNGFVRKKTKPEEIEIIKKEEFIQEILDPNKTPQLIWSSSILKKEDVQKIYKIPDIGSPHLVDHAFLALVGNVNGGIVVNKTFSTHTSHNTNFSKLHFETYLSGCKGFYVLFFKLNHPFKKQVLEAVTKHLGLWFIGAVFNLKKFYTIKQPNANTLNQVNEFALEILNLPFMKKFKTKFYCKQFIFKVKTKTGLLL